MCSSSASSVAATITSQAVDSSASSVAATIMRQAVESRQAFIATREAYLTNEDVQAQADLGGIPKVLNLVMTRDIGVNDDPAQLDYNHGVYVATKSKDLTRQVTNKFNDSPSAMNTRINATKSEASFCSESKKPKTKLKRRLTCPNCGREFGNSAQRESKEMVSNHLALCGTNLPKLDSDLSFVKETIKCNINGCQAFFKSDKRLNFHVALIHGQNSLNLQCPLCFQNFGKAWLEMNRHFNRCLRPEAPFCFHCQVCGAELKSHLDVMKLHYKYHAGVRDHVCAGCGSSFMDSNTLRDHERLHLKTIAFKAIGDPIGVAVADKKVLGKCGHCGKEMVKKNLHAHVKSVHLGQKPLQREKKKREFTCLVCDHKTKSSWAQLVQHLAAHKELTAAELTCEGYRAECGRQFSALLELHSHFYTVHWDGVLCSVCDVVIITKGYYADHMTSHSDIKAFRCSHCSKSFKKKSQLDIHESRHTGEGKYECSICGKRFPQGSEVRNHELQHGTAKSFSCGFCGKAFKRDAYLRIHMKTHQKKSPHIPPSKHNTPNSGILLRQNLAPNEISNVASVPEFVSSQGRSRIVHEGENVEEDATSEERILYVDTEGNPLYPATDT